MSRFNIVRLASAGNTSIDSSLRQHNFHERDCILLKMNISPYVASCSWMLIVSWRISKAPKSESEALYHRIIIIATNSFWRLSSLKRLEWRAWELNLIFRSQLARVGGSGPIASFFKFPGPAAWRVALTQHCGSSLAWCFRPNFSKRVYSLLV